jgi:hypothetical protein
MAVMVHEDNNTSNVQFNSPKFAGSSGMVVP